MPPGPSATALQASSLGAKTVMFEEHVMVSRRFVLCSRLRNVEFEKVTLADWGGMRTLLSSLMLMGHTTGMPGSFNSCGED